MKKLFGFVNNLRMSSPNNFRLSSPRRRGSSTRWKSWIPACAGMTALLVSSCGGGSFTGSEDTGNGSLTMVVFNSKTNGTNEFGKIKNITVTVEGAGITEPITKEFLGDASYGVIDGIPSGGERKVTVRAVNINDKLVREGIEENVEVVPNTTSSIGVEMDAVPAFMNVNDGNSIVGNRLSMKIFSDPNDEIEIVDVTDGEGQPLLDISSSSSVQFSNSVTGIAQITPAVISAGEHIFRARSRLTGKYSDVSVKIMDGSKVRPAPFLAGANGSALIGNGIISVPFTANH